MRPERALTWALAALAVAAPLVIGGVHPWTQVALSAVACAVAALWLATRGKRGLRMVPFVLPAAIGVAFTLVQLVPLPSVLVGVLSPSALELRNDLGSQAFVPLTLDVPATTLELVKGLACLALLLVSASVARPVHRAHRLLITIALLGAGIVVLMVVQRAVGARAILGVYTPRSQSGSGFSGTFVDSNHAASLFSLAALVSLGLALELDGVRRGLMLGAAGVSIVGVLFTMSRAGAGGLAVGGFALATVLFGKRFGRVRGLLAALLLAAILSSSALWAADGLRGRFEPSVENLWANQKVRGWRDSLRMAARYPWTGVGRGAFEAPLAAFRVHDETVRLVYPENLVLQITTEWGVPIAAAVLVLAFLAAMQLLPYVSRLENGTIGALCGVLAVVVHELADFGLEFPGVAFPTTIALGVVVARVEEKAGKHGPERRSLPWFAGAAGLGIWLFALIGAAWAAPRTLDADWAHCQAAAKAKSPDAQALIAEALLRHPSSDHLELLATDGAADSSALKHLNRALRLHPANAQAHHLAARRLARLNYRSQAALEYRVSMELGELISYDEVIRVVGSQILEAVPQTAEGQLGLAHFLARSKRPQLAVKAAALGVELAEQSEAALEDALSVAVETGDPKAIANAARALVDQEPAAQAYIAAARAFVRAGSPADADDAIARGIKVHPGDSQLVLAGAKQRLDRGDFSGARGMLRHVADGGFTLADRKSAEELNAQIADKSGDVDGAILARARAKLIAHKLEASGQ